MTAFVLSFLFLIQWSGCFHCSSADILCLASWVKFEYQLQEHSPNGMQQLPYYTVDGFITGLVTVELLNKTTFCYLYSFLLQINKNTENIYYSNKTFPLWIDFQGLKETFCSEDNWRWNKEIFSAFCSAITQRSRALIKNIVSTFQHTISLTMRNGKVLCMSGKLNPRLQVVTDELLVHELH